MSKKANKKNLTGGNSAATIAVAEKVPGGKRKKFLDFNISTSNANTGTQQYGAGQSIRSRSLRAGNGSRQSGPRGRNMGDTGHVEHLTDHLSMHIPLNREMVAEVTASEVAFTVVSFDINPGLAEVFAWMGLTAQNFQKYYFKQLRFHYVTQCSGYAIQGQQGKVVLAFDLDSLEGPPDNLKQALSIAPSIMTIPSESVTLEVPSNLLSPENGLFVRKGVVPGDLKTYDIGRLYLITEGVVGESGPLGVLEVEYEIALQRPRIAGIALTSNPSAITFRTTKSSYGVPGGPYLLGDTTIGFTPWNDLAAAGAFPAWPQIGSLAAGLDPNGVIRLPQGRYRFTIWVFHTVANTGFNLQVNVTGPPPATVISYGVMADSYASAITSTGENATFPVVCALDGISEVKLAISTGGSIATGALMVNLMIEYMRPGFEM